MIMKRFGRLVVVLSLLGTLFSSASARQEPSTKAPAKPEVIIGLDREQASADYVAKIVHGFGQVRKKESDVSAYRVQFASRERFAERLAKISRAKGVKFVIEANPLFSENPDRPDSLVYMDRSIATLTAIHELRKEAEEELGIKQGKREGEEEEEAQGLDYLQAYRAWVSIRAYPKQTLDWTGYTRAIAQAKQMQRVEGYITRGMNDNKATYGWEYVGPTNLDIPYRIYYGQPPLSGRVNAVAFDPVNAGTFYAGFAQGGVWKTTDNGATFTVLGDDWDINHVSSIAIDPKNPNTIYVATGDFPGSTFYGIGIMKSIDGGNTWVNLGRSTFNNTAISKVMVDPDNPNIVVVTTGHGAGFNGRVYRSTDGGQNWGIVVNVAAPWSGAVMGIPRANNANRYYFAVGGGPGGNVYRSIDLGVTWTKLTVPISSGFHQVLDIAASQVNPEVVYLLVGQDSKILKSTDGGTNWTDTTNNFPTGYIWSQQSYNYHIETSKRMVGTTLTDVIYVGQVDLVQSADGGTTWASIGGPSYTNGSLVHNDQHSLAINPLNPNDALVGNDGGLFRFAYTPGGSGTWTSLNKNLGGIQFYDGAWHPTDPNKMIGGTQDNSSPVSRGDINNWDNVGGGDGFGAAINQQNPNFQYCTSQFGTVYRTTTGWANQQNISPNTGNDNTPFHTRIYLDINNGNILYYMSNYLWRKVEPSGAWEPRLGNTELTSGQFIITVAVAPGDSSRIYTGSDSGDLWMSQDNGATWTKINTGLPDRAYTGISVNPIDKNDIVVCLSGFGSPKIWRCSNVLASPRVWTNISGTGASAFPDLPASSITRDPTAPQTTWYVATDIGVYKTDDAGANWQNATIALGLPNVEVTKIEANPSTRFLNVATYGRGMWRIPISQLIPPKGTLTIDPTAVLGGFSATGTITLDSPAGGAGVDVALFSSNAILAQVPASVIVPSGQTTAVFTITTKQVVAASTVQITATGEGIAQTQALLITPISPASLDLDLPDVIGGTFVTGTVTLSAPAPPGGAAVTLASTNPIVAKLQRNWVLVPEGNISTTFGIQTIPVLAPASIVISAERGGIKATANLNVRRPTVITLTTASATVAKNKTLVATITIDGNAPLGGFPVALQSSDTRIAKVPASVTIPAGKRTVTFLITAQNVVKPGNVTITARFGTQGQTKVISVTN